MRLTCVRNFASAFILTLSSISVSAGSWIDGYILRKGQNARSDKISVTQDSLGLKVISAANKYFPIMDASYNDRQQFVTNGERSLAKIGSTLAASPDWKLIRSSDAVDEKGKITGGNVFSRQAQVDQARSLGFVAYVFENIKTHEHVLAFRGSEQSTSASNVVDPGYADGNQNIKQFFDGPYKAGAYILARAAARNEQVLDPNTVLVGHSLGGGEAQFAASETGLRAITYNAAGLDSDQFSRGFNGNIANINAKNDPVSEFGNQIGQEYILPFQFVTPHERISIRSALDEAYRQIAMQDTGQVANTVSRDQSRSWSMSPQSETLSNNALNSYVESSRTSGSTAPVVGVPSVPVTPIVPPISATSEVLYSHGGYAFSSYGYVRFQDESVNLPISTNSTYLIGSNIFGVASGVLPQTITLNSTTRGSYQYTDWGDWTNPQLTGSLSQTGGAHWVIGRSPITVAQLPSSGSATYSGESIGRDGIGAGSPTSNKTVSGTVNLNVNFATSRVAANIVMNNFTHSFSAMPILARNGFASFYGTGTQNSSNSITGNFFGVHANGAPAEAGGSFSVNSGLSAVSGVWRARQAIRVVGVGEN